MVLKGVQICCGVHERGRSVAEPAVEKMSKERAQLVRRKIVALGEPVPADWEE